MRELKFRAWSKTQKKMYDRVLAGNGDDPCSLVWVEESAQWACFDGLDGTIMQFTGLTDQHGKQIYEGDIVKLEDYGIAKVGYGIGTFVYHCTDGNRLALEDESTTYVEIIGNIHEHPHLSYETPC